MASEVKADSHFRRHRLSFETTLHVFANPKAKERVMARKLIQYTFQLDRLAPLTRQQKAEIDALKAASESAIDEGDLPPLTDEFWKNAVRNPFYRPTQSTTTVRLDSDVLLWLKSQGKGYPTRRNAILREALLKALHKKA